VTYGAIVALILNVAAAEGVPAFFALSIALTENPALDPLAVSRMNQNGTVDRGIFQLNSAFYNDIAWDNVEINVRAGVAHIKGLMRIPELNTFYSVAISYNAGTAWLATGQPPQSSVTYAANVMAKWNELSGGRAQTVIRRSGP
jgi:soluble lytic murein transglycosylase-like protein